MRLLLVPILATLLSLPASAQSLQEFQKKVTEFTLANGFHFIVVERHDAPVVAFNSYVNAGSVDDPAGQTGIAHMFEHMAFKGTSSIGTTNWGIERQQLIDIEKAYNNLEEEQNKGPRADPQKVQQLISRLKTEIDLGEKYVNQNLFTRIIEANGGVGLNAQTSHDATVFYYSLPSNRAELWFLLESQRFYDPVFREFYKEREVVLEERRMSTDSNPEGLLREVFAASAFEAHPYRNPTGGWPSDILSFRLRDALAFFKKYYVPSNITFGIAGDISASDARRLAEKYFSIIPAGPTPPLIHTVEPRQQGERQAVLESDSQPIELIGYKRPSERSPDDAVLEVIAGVLAGGRTGTIYKDLVRDKKVALSAGAMAAFPAGKYPNLFVFYLYPNLGRTSEECEKPLSEAIERLKTEKVDEATLRRIRAQLRLSLISRLETNESLASEVALYAAIYGDWRKLFTELEDFDKVTADDVMRVARQYFIPEWRTTARIVPTAASAGRAVQAHFVRWQLMRPRIIPVLRLMLLCMVVGLEFLSAQPAKAPAKPAAKPAPSNAAPDAEPVVVREPGPLPSALTLAYAPLGEIHIPKPVIVTLSNGMKVYLLENHDLPLVRGTAVIRTGNLFDPKDKRGLATLTGTTIRSGGTKSMTGDQLDEKLEGIAASIESEIGESSATGGFSCLSENTDSVLGWFRDVLTTPEFRQEKIDLAKTQMKSEISRRNDDAAAIANREILSILYGQDTPYGGDETYATVNAVTRDDIRSFYQRYYFPANIILALYGDFQTAQMQQKLETLFASWKVTQEKVPPFPAVDAKPDPGVFFVEKEDVTQTFFEIGHLGGELSDKDLPALSVAADLLGGGFSSRLFREVRSRLGYAYSIGASWDAAYDHPGVFLIAGSTKSQTTEETIAAVLKEVDRLRSSEVTDQELSTARDAALNSLVFAFERPASTLSRLVTYDYFGYPADFLLRYEHALQAVTKADVLRVSKEYFNPQRFSIVAVGNQNNFGRPLGDLNLPVKPLDVSIPLDQPAQTAGEKQAGQQLLAKALEWVGGASRFLAIQDLTQTEEMQTRSNPKKRVAKLQYAAPSTIREEQDLEDGSHLTVFSDGTRGWRSSGSNTADLGEGAFPVIAANMSHRFVFILQKLSKNPDQARYAGRGVFEWTDADGQPMSLTVDEKTGAVLKTRFNQKGQVEETFSDWRDVSGMKFPFHAELALDDKPVAARTALLLKVNTHLNPEELRKRP